MKSPKPNEKIDPKKDIKKNADTTHLKTVSNKHKLPFFSQHTSIATDTTALPTTQENKSHCPQQ